MADTGAPWNIPYQEPADIVRDYPAASEVTALAIAAGLTAAGNAGIGSNVQTVEKTDVFTTTSNSFTAATGMSVTITPSSNTARILVIVYLSYFSTTNDTAQIELRRGSTSVLIGDSAGSRTRASAASTPVIASDQSQATLVLLDSPNTDSAVTYSIMMRRALNAGTVGLNRTSGDNDATAQARTASTITAIEVAV